MGWEEGRGPVRSSAMEREIFALWAPEPAKEPSWHVHQEARKLPSFLVLSLLSSLHVPLQSPVHTALQPRLRSFLTWGSGEDGRDESHAQTPLPTSVSCRNIPHPHILGLLDIEQEAPMPSQWVLGMVDSVACLWWGICILGLGLHLLAGVLLGQGVLAQDSNAPHSLTSLGEYHGQMSCRV